MLKYEDYLQKCFLLGRSDNGQDFIRSRFDYYVRQRRAVRGYPVHAFTLQLDRTELLSFQNLWTDLDEGTDIFVTDQVVHGDLTTNKQVRFTKGYTLEEISHYRWKLSCSIELIKTGG